jgi:cytochrome c-type biogenesis protein CcmH
MQISTFKLVTMRVIFFCLFLAVLVLSASAGAVQGSAPSDDEVNRIASQLYCPICDNMALDVCPLEACRAWRELIREQLAEGWTELEIKAYFVAQYGDRVLGEPPRSGLNWILYLVPPVIILLGLILLVSKLKRPTQQQREQNTDPEDIFIQQVERDLENLD